LHEADGVARDLQKGAQVNAMGRHLLLLLVFVSLVLVGPAAAQVRTASLAPNSAVQTERPRLGDGSATQALRRALRSDLVDAGLLGACRHYRLPTTWARLAGVATIAPATARRFSCHLTADLLDLSVGVDLHHYRGWGALVKVDLDDRRVVVEAAAKELHYGVAYEQGGTVQALLRLPF